MKLSFDVPFECPEDIRPHLHSVFAGEYDIPLRTSGLKILDIGANCGAFALWAAHRFPLSDISSYEPHPENFKFLRNNTKGYPVHTHPWGLGSAGMRPLYDGKNNGGEASLYGQDRGTLGQHVEIKDPTTLPDADIIKLDTEGCEVEILEPLLKRGRNFLAVMFEYHRIGDRKIIDSLLADYILIGAHVYSPGRGVCKYLHKNLVQE